MSLARDVTTVGTATLLSRLLGFFRDVGIAAVLGAGVLSDAYFAALQIPNLFRRLLAEGALNSAFVPMWLRIREKRGMRGTRGFAERVLGTMVVGLGVIAIAFCGPLGTMSTLCAVMISLAFGSRSCLTTTSPNSASSWAALRRLSRSLLDGYPRI